MNPVKQTAFGYPQGNCYAACLASITGIPLEAFPVWRKGLSDARWFREMDSFLIARGWISVTCVTNHEGRKVVPRGYSIASGLTPRETFDENDKRVYHAVIALDGELIHDPAPGDLFLKGPVTSWTIMIPLINNEEQ